MLVNIHHDSKREHARLLVAGVAFLTGVAVLIAFSIAIYLKTFDHVTMVTIKADRAGLQLPKYGDVRIHGVLVGQVRSVKDDGKEAVIKVAVQPSEADRIPANVDVEILPTTLFGQKFIQFVMPSDPSTQSLHDGQVIPASRVKTNVELSKILADLFPLLRAVQPAQLNMTLNALATALSGRGEELGQTLVKLNGYLGSIDDKLPTLRTDLQSLAHVADTYDIAAPDLLDVLGNLTVTSRTVTQKADDLNAFFTHLTGLSDTSTAVLRNNGRNIIEVGKVGEPVLGLLATYSPEFPCLIEGAARYAPRLSETFAGDQIKQYISFATPQYQPYHEDDRPVYGEVGHGPWCDGLPYPQVPIGPQAFKEGSDIDEHPPTSNMPTQVTQGGGSGSGSGGAGPLGRALEQRSTAATVDPESSGFAGTDADKAIIDMLLAEQTGRVATSYGALGSLLYGPVVRGGSGQP